MLFIKIDEIQKLLIETSKSKNKNFGSEYGVGLVKVFASDNPSDNINDFMLKLEFKLLLFSETSGDHYVWQVIKKDEFEIVL